MIPRASNLIGLSLIAALVLAVVIGILLLRTADKMPAHTDEQRAVELMDQYLDHNPEFAQAAREVLRDQIVRLRTYKWEIYDAGLVLTLVASILLFVMVHFGLWDLRRLQEMTTPQTRFRLLTIAGTAWFALLPAILLDIRDDYARDDIAPTVDTGHGIFLVVGPPFFLVTLVAITAFGRYVVLRNAHFPASLWIWDHARARRSLTWTVFYGFLGCMLVALAIKAVWNSPWFLPSLMIGLYVIASTRAAIMNGSQNEQSGTAG